MTGKFKKISFIAAVIIGLSAGLFGAINKARAFDTLALTITPPLFQLSIGPGETWKSSLKIVNTNPYDLTVYASAMNFEPGGEEGQGRFIPILSRNSGIPLTAGENGANNYSLAKWIQIASGTIFIPEGKSADIPFTVQIPKDAEAGGHYAAILVGTYPQNENSNGANVLVSSQVSSLFLVRVSGDIREDGYISEFKSGRSFYEKPDVGFTLRFENIGNVHLKPQGEIAIFNMWGGELGRIPINEKSEFGNVLPQSARKFIFNWQKDFNFLEMGRFKAIATVSYGEDARQNLSRVVYFWILPVKPLVGAAASLLVFILMIVLLIRRYIKRSLAGFEQRIIFNSRHYAKAKRARKNKPSNRVRKQN